MCKYCEKPIDNGHYASWVDHNGAECELNQFRQAFTNGDVKNLWELVIYEPSEMVTLSIEEIYYCPRCGRKLY